MPDAAGNFKGIAVPAGAWERIFGRPQPDGCTCPGKRPAYHGKGCPVPNSLTEKNRSGGRW